MARRVVLLGVFLGPVVVGCGESRRPHATPVTLTPTTTLGAAAAGEGDAARALTRPPRAIATH
jgi:hypothetical protein